FVTDHLGSVRASIDAAGIPRLRKYWPFGGELAANPSTPQRIRFGAMEGDIDSGISGTSQLTRYYDHARGHEVSLGRFLSPDKLVGRLRDPQSWNRYTYAINNPLKFVDPNGLEVQYADKHVKSLFERLAKRYPAFKATLNRYRGAGAPDLQVRRGDAEGD